MNLKETTKINRKIMVLIRSKNPEDFPNAYNTPESRYYRRLELDTEEAERYLEESSPR